MGTLLVLTDREQAGFLLRWARRFVDTEDGALAVLCVPGETSESGKRRLSGEGFCKTVARIVDELD